MCVTVYQFVGYQIPTKKISKNINQILKGYNLWNLDDEKSIYIILE